MWTTCWSSSPSSNSARTCSRPESPLLRAHLRLLVFAILLQPSQFARELILEFQNFAGFILKTRLRDLILQEDFALTEKQKAEIAEIVATFKAKIAEREVFLQDQIAKARFNGKDGEVLELEDQLAREIRRIQQDCEDKKAKVRPK